MSDFTPIIHTSTYALEQYSFYVNAYLVETAGGVVAIDAGCTISAAREMRRQIEEDIGKPLVAVLLTHGHPDHYAGLGTLVDGASLEIYSTRGALDFAVSEDVTKAELAAAMFGDDWPNQRAFPTRVVGDGETVDFDGVGFTVIDMGPGESASDSIWHVEIDGVRHAFIGDIIYNNMHSSFGDGYPEQWLASLDRLLREFDHTARLYCGHSDAPCGTEMAYWQKGYINAFMDNLKALLDGSETLDEDQRQVLFAKMQSYLPNQKCLGLLTYGLDEALESLRAHEII
jgi:glyoxylase-like metal-dependent hydrolase (beta-lactamase superfamily II)